jgi:hypothetical protein
MFLLFNILNPFKKFAQKFYKYSWYWSKRLTENKSLEIETFVDSEHLIQLQFCLRLKGRHHAGPSFELVLFCIGLAARIYDNRHWDYETNDWEVR